MKRDTMREVMREYNRNVKKAMEGDKKAQEWLISSPRGDSIHIDCRANPRRQESGSGLPCKYCEYRTMCKDKAVDIPKRWASFEEWKAWNRQHGKGNPIRRMMKDV